MPKFAPLLGFSWEERMGKARERGGWRRGERTGWDGTQHKLVSVSPPLFDTKLCPW